jgi:hypothetical protein
LKLLNEYNLENIYRKEENEYTRKNSNNVNYIDYVHQINIKIGVLQEGILSPTFFNLYLTDLIYELNKISNDVPIYADN